MSSASLAKVRWMTIAQLAEKWAPELELPRGILEDELRRSFINLPRLAQGKGLVEQLPSEDKLPPLTQQVERGHVRAFCKKQWWPLPAFWFGEQNEGPSYPGRPSIMNSIKEEMKLRAAKGKLKPRIGEEANELFIWSQGRFVGEQIPTTRTIENGIRVFYRQLKPSNQR